MDLVEEAGEFALRGGVVDLHTGGATDDNPGAMMLVIAMSQTPEADALTAMVGTINGAGEYYFMAEISDGPDGIWLTIFDEYDSGGIVDLVRGRIRIRQWP